MTEDKMHDYDGTERTVAWMKDHLRTSHGIVERPDQLRARVDAGFDEADIHARAHKRESGIGDRQATPEELAAIVMKFVDETINDPEYVNSHGDPMPWNVLNFSTLHDYVDANMYLIEAEAHFGSDGGWSFPEGGDEDAFERACARANAVTDLVAKQLADRVEGVKSVMEWRTDECFARIIQPRWLTERSFILNWTDYVTQEETYRFNQLSEATVCLGVLIHCGEDAWRSGFNVDNEGMAGVIHDFFGKAVS